MSQAVLLWPRYGQGPQLRGMMGLSTASTSSSLLLKPWSAAGREVPRGNARFLYSDILSSRKSLPQARL